MHAFCAPFMTASPSSGAQAQADEAAISNKKPVVFVAGATGNVGKRLVRQLAQTGCTVRAGSRDRDRFETLIGDVSGYEGSVSHVPFDVVNPSCFREALGNASVVVSALGAPFSFGAVDGRGIANLMRSAATTEGVRQLIVVSSIGVGRPWAFPAAMLNLLGGVLVFKDFSESVTRNVAREFDKRYCIVRPGGMEAPTDSYGDTHNLRLEGRNKLASGNVSNLQIAQLIVAAVLNPEDADGKTVEAVAEETAPKLDYRTLLIQAPKD